MTQEKIIRGKECVNMNRGCKATAEPRHEKKTKNGEEESDRFHSKSFNEDFHRWIREFDKNKEAN